LMVPLSVSIMARVIAFSPITTLSSYPNGGFSRFLVHDRSVDYSDLY
jgi:hypothetical protein